MSDELPPAGSEDLAQRLPPALPPGREGDFYRRLRDRVRTYAESRAPVSDQTVELLLAAPDLFYLLVRLSTDARVPLGKRLKLAGLVTYFILPFDLLPEAILGATGFLDDMFLGLGAVVDLLESTDPAVVREHWPGRDDVLEVSRQRLDLLRGLLGARGVRRLLRRFRRR